MSPSRTRKNDLRGADVDLLKILAVQSGDVQRIRRALTSDAPLSPSLVPHVIPLVALEGAALDAMRALRDVAIRCPGVLADALLDLRTPTMVRRRLARVMSVSRSPHVVDALLQGCDDEQGSLRVECARSLFRLRRRHPEFRFDGEAILALIRKELHRSVEDAALIFTLLALVFPAAPIRAAYRSLRGADRRARGFALEYVHSIVPADVREKLAGVMSRMDGTGRPKSRRRQPLGTN
jgi:hypothetical protein